MFGINDNNIVVGESYATMTSDFADAMAWKWNGSTGGTMVNLASAIGAASGTINYGWGINNLNQVTGGVPYDLNNYTGYSPPGYKTPYVLDITHAFDPTPSTTIKWLLIPGGVGTLHGGIGVAINDNGCVVSQGIDIGPTTNSYYDGGDPNASDSYAKPMDHPSGFRTCYTSAINNAGYVLCTAATASYPVGWVVDTTAGSNVTTYDRDVPPIVSGGTDVPIALNNNAAPMIVGYASTSRTAAASTPSSGPRPATTTDLNTYAANLNATNLTGWVFQEADSLNNNGEVVGYGTLNGVNHAFALLNYSGPGDANGDSKVDINDLTIVLSNYNKSGVGWLAGDFNGDYKVDINDLTIVLSNYNHTYSSSAIGASAVPEPGAGAAGRRSARTAGPACQAAHDRLRVVVIQYSPAN